MSHQQNGHKDPVRIGLIVFLVLAVVTVIEYVIAVEIEANIPILAAIAVLKAGLIFYYFMHIVRAWKTEEEDA